MSAHALLNSARRKIDTAIQEQKAELAARFGDSESDMRLRQGIIEGQRLAILYLEEAYKEL